MKVSLESARVNAKLSPEQVAQAIDKCVGTIRNYESGKTSPKWNVLVELCNLYGCTTDDIIMPTQ